MCFWPDQRHPVSRSPTMQFQHTPAAEPPASDVQSFASEVRHKMPSIRPFQIAQVERVKNQTTISCFCRSSVLRCIVRQLRQLRQLNARTQVKDQGMKPYTEFRFRVITLRLRSAWIILLTLLSAVCHMQTQNGSVWKHRIPQNPLVYHHHSDKNGYVVVCLVFWQTQLMACRLSFDNCESARGRVSWFISSTISRTSRLRQK